MTHDFIPDFEGHEVVGTLMKMSGAAPLEELTDVVVGVDDTIQMISQFRCVGVHHRVGSDGQLVRVQVLRPILMELCPINPDDPNDDGILRAVRPTKAIGDGS